MNKTLFPIAFCILILVSCAAAPTGSKNGSETPPLPSIYVAATGNDNNAGTDKSAPVRTLQVAVANAATNGYNNVYVAEGVYTNGAGLLSFTNSNGTTNSGLVISNCNINIIGGCDPSSFAPVTGHFSVLDRGGLPDHVVLFLGATNVVLNGFIIVGGYAATPDPITLRVGGGIFLTNAQYCVITNCLLTNNDSWYGAGMGLMNSRNNVISAFFMGNVNSGYGGGIALLTGADQNFLSVIVVDHASGGGIWINGGYSNFITGMITNNTNQDGGGVRLNTGQYNIFSNCIFSGNSTSGGNFGGGILISDPRNIIVDSFFSNNYSSHYGGGAILSGAFCAVSNSVFFNNLVSNGGAISTYGGGIHVESLNAVIYNCTFINNKARCPSLSSYGGGVSTSQNGGIQILESFFSNNSSGYAGGAIANNLPSGANYTTVRSNLITCNYSDTFAGGIYSESGIYILQNMIISNNTGSVGSGLFLYAWALISSNLIATNGANSYGSVMWVESCAVTNLNNIFLGDQTVIGLRNANGSVFSSNTIGGSSAVNSGYGFNENTYNETSGHVLTYNLFLTNRLGNLYYDFNGNHVVTNSASFWNDINNTTYSGATTAAFNFVTNL